MKEPSKLPESLATIRLKDSWVYATAYGLALLVILFLQMTPHGLPTVGGARPILVIPFVVFVSMFRGPLFGGVIGAVAGLLWGMFSDRLLGVDALLLLTVGCVCGLLVYMLMRNNLISAMLLAVGATVLVCFADWFLFTVIWNPQECVYALWRLVLPDMLYTILMAPPLYGVLFWMSKRMKMNE